MLKIGSLSLLLLLSACEADIKAPSGQPERVQMAADADGKVAFNLPFAKGEIKLPAGVMSNADFDIDGVKLMPGAKLTGFNLDAGEGSPGKVNFTFTAPSTPQEARAYFMDQFRAQGVTAAVAADAIQGRTKEGNAFLIRFAPQGSGTSGTIELDVNTKRS